MTKVRIFKSRSAKRVFFVLPALLLILGSAFGGTSLQVAARETTTISAGGGHSMVIKTDGSLWVWGSNDYGQLGDGRNEEMRSYEVKIMDSVASVSAGGGHSMAIKTDGSLWAWGSNDYGQLGGGRRIRSYRPIKIMDSVVSVSAGGSHTMAIKADGSLWAWGNNMYGQLGDGTRENRFTPVRIMDSVASVSAGGSHTMAVKTDGSLWAWGSNDYGQLGDGTRESRFTPARIMDSVTSVSAGSFHTMAIKIDGSLWAWGSNMYDQLGNGTSEHQRIPVQVMHSVASVSAGGSHTMAIKTDGSLWAWGSNTNGQLGDGMTERYHNRPVIIMYSVASVSAGSFHTMAIKTNGSLWVWGGNSVGQILNGAGVRRLSPIQIMGDIRLPSTTPIATPAVPPPPATSTTPATPPAVPSPSATPATPAATPAVPPPSATPAPPSASPTVPPPPSAAPPSNTTPIYTYPQPTLTEAQVRAIVEALAGRLGGEITQFYKLADDLYYVVITLNGQAIGGAVVREGRMGGNIVFHVEHAGFELLTEAQLAPYISMATSTPNVTINYNAVSGFTTRGEYSDYLRDAIRDVDGTSPNDAALHDIVTYIQNAISSQAVAILTSTGNQLLITGSDIVQTVRDAQQSYDGLMGILQDNYIELGRPVTIIIRIEGQNLDPGEIMQVTLDISLADILGGNSIMLMLGGSRHAVTISGDNLQALINQYGAVTIQIQQTSSGIYIIVFIDANGNIIDRLPAPVAITIPASGMFDTVFASIDGRLENWGGQFDEIAWTLQFSTPFTGTYEVMENLFDLPDIANFAEEIRNAISFMVSKGFFELKDGRFDPDGVLSRYEFSTTLVRMFFALDRSLETSFIDVPAGIEYYDYIASGEHEGLIEGIGNDLFAGERIMNRQEAVTVAARALANKKGYTYPANPEYYLSSYIDAQDIADWARSPVSIAAREGLVSMGGSFAPLREITRSEAATILYRLFMLLYETPPVAVEMEPLAAAQPELESESVQPDGAAQQNGTAAQQNGTAAQQNGTAAQQNGTAAQQDGTAAQQDGTAEQQDGTAAQQDETAAQQDETAAQQDGTAAQQDGTAEEKSKFNILPILLGSVGAAGAICGGTAVYLKRKKLSTPADTET